MKKMFSLFLICYVSFAFAEGEPTFEETNGKVSIHTVPAYSLDGPIFEEDDESEAKVEDKKGCEECDDPKHGSVLCLSPQFHHHGEGHENPPEVNYFGWKKYKVNFGAEKVFLSFPPYPIFCQSGNIFTASAYDGAVLYTFSGYFPSMGSMDPSIFFDEVRFAMNCSPYTLINQDYFQDIDGYWVLDYLAYDSLQNLKIKGRAVVTPFNAYLIRCIKPNGSIDDFSYFIDQFRIKRDFD
jgi:hypothetical protein